MRPEDTQRCVPDPDWETPQQQFDIALAKKQAEIDQLNEDNKWLLDNFFNRNLAIEDIANIVEISDRNKGE